MLKKASILLLIVAFLFTGFSSIFAEEWYAFQRDESRSGMVKETLYFPMKETLRIPIGEKITGGILIHSNNVYYSTIEGTIGCASVFSGDIQWTRKLDEGIKSSMMISNKDLFAVTENGHVYCIDAKTGTILWDRNMETKIEAPLLKFYRYLIVPSVDGIIYALNSLDGITIWETDLHEKITKGVCFKFNSLYVVTEKGQIACYDSQSGKKHWNFYATAKSKSSPIAGTEAIYYGDDAGSFYAYDYITGRRYWKKELNDPFSSPLGFSYFDKRIVCAGMTNRYAGISVGTGTELWSYPSDACGIGPVSANRVVFLPGNNQTIVALDSFDGTEVFSSKLDSPISAGMAISNGKLFLGTEAGDIVIFGSANYDFFIEMVDEVQTISPGESCKFKIKISCTEGFHDPISFSASGFPCSCKGVGRWFDHSLVKPPGEVNLVVDTTEEAKPAKYRITIKAFSGNRDIQREAYGVLVIQEEGQETILSMDVPENISVGQDFTVPINIENAKKLRSLGYTIDYPKDKLFLKEVLPGDYFLGPEDEVDFDYTIDKKNGRVSVGYSRKDLGESGSGHIGFLKFQAKESTKDAPVELSFSNVSLRDTLLFTLTSVNKKLSFNIKSGKTTTISLQIGSNKIKINDRIEKLDAPPYIKDGRTLVPLRAIAENMNASIEWFAKERKIRLTQYDTVIDLWIDKPTCLVNDEKIELPDKVSPAITNGRTFIPLRFVTEQLHGKISWDGSTQTITIVYPIQ